MNMNKYKQIDIANKNISLIESKLPTGCKLLTPERAKYVYIPDIGSYKQIIILKIMEKPFIHYNDSLNFLEISNSNIYKKLPESHISKIESAWEPIEVTRGYFEFSDHENNVKIKANLVYYQSSTNPPVNFPLKKGFAKPQLEKHVSSDTLKTFGGLYNFSKL